MAGPVGESRWRGALSVLESYFRRVVVERRTTPHNPLLEVVQIQGRRLLFGKSVNYSFGSLHRMFEVGFERMRLEDRPLSSALVLGYGAGDVATLLRREYAPRCRIVGVEIDPGVIELMRRHFPPPPGPSVEIVRADAVEWVTSASRRRADPDALFDLVVVDLFVDDRVPPGVETAEFLCAAVGRLQPGGMLVYNRLAHADTAREDSLCFAREVFEPTLGNASVLEVRKNILLVHERPA